MSIDGEVLRLYVPVVKKSQSTSLVFDAQIRVWNGIPIVWKEILNKNVSAG